MKLTIITVLVVLGSAWAIQICQAAELGDSTLADMHNEKRRVEGASNMKIVSWDSILAAEAADHADQCTFNHAQNLQDGENLFITTAAFSTGVFQSAINAWYNEVNFYNFDINSCALGKMCGHYTAIVWANTEKIGCAARHCPGGITDGFSSGTIVVCRYSPEGNFIGQKPYTKGTACVNCPSGWDVSCDNGLCSKEAPVLPETTTAGVSVVTTTTTTPASKPVTTQSTTVDDGGQPEPTSKPPITESTTKDGDGHPEPTSTTSTAQTPGTDHGKPTAETTYPFPGSTAIPRGTCTEEYLDLLDDYRRGLEEWKQVFRDWKENNMQSCQ